MAQDTAQAILKQYEMLCKIGLNVPWTLDKSDTIPIENSLLKCKDGCFSKLIIQA